MSDLVCIGLQKEPLIDLEDSSLVVHEEYAKVHLKRALILVSLGSASGGGWRGLWGILIGSYFLHPLVGLFVGGTVGAGLGAFSGKSADCGINDDFIKRLGGTIPPNHSALFPFIRQVTADRVLPEIQSYGGKRMLSGSRGNSRVMQSPDNRGNRHCSFRQRSQYEPPTAPTPVASSTTFCKYAWYNARKGGDGELTPSRLKAGMRRDPMAAKASPHAGSGVDHATNPFVQARQAIAVFDCGSGGLVTAAYLTRIADECDLAINVAFFGDTAHLPYGVRIEQQVAKFSDEIICRLAILAPVVGIACNTASASWAPAIDVYLSRPRGSHGQPSGDQQPQDLRRHLRGDATKGNTPPLGFDHTTVYESLAA